MTEDQPVDQMEPSAPGVMALDVGDARIGVAVSESRLIATTVPAIRRVGRTQTLDAIEKLAARYRVGTVVIGLPLLEDGSEGEQAEKTRGFSRSLSRRFPHMKIQFWDERYSSGHARDILGPGQQAKGRVDSVAAAVILQEWLDHHTTRRGERN